MRHSVNLSALTVMVGFLLSGCAGTADQAGQNDPFEQTNRAIFKANMTLDKAVAKPVAEGYAAVVPDFARTGIHNVLKNLEKPVVLGNDVLQLEGQRAGETLARFITNTILGIGGLIDVATMTGLPDHDEDFGQTLAVWGFGEGPYLMLPMMGPSSPRGVVGMGGDYFMDPLNYAHYDYENLANDMHLGFKLADVRSRNLGTLESVERSSIDFYATTRSLYRQMLKSEIANGHGSADDDMSDINLPPDDMDDMGDDAAGDSSSN